MSDKDKTKELYAHGMYEFVNNNFEKSVDILTDAADADPDSSLVFVSRGSAYLKLNRLDEARSDFDRAIELDPQYPRAFHLRGLVSEKGGNDNDALEDFNRAIELDPEYGAAYHSRATLHTKMGNEDLAVDDISMVQHLTNKAIETYANENNVWRSQHMRLESMLETG